MRNIPFSPPDISELEIQNVVEVLKSGWITTGPKTKLFEQKIAEYCKTNKAVCLNSATACMELTLRLLGIGEGDEVITSAYTYTASASVITHVGATPVMVDTEKDSFFMNLNELEGKITEKTKAIIAVDIAGVMCDFDKLIMLSERKKDLFKAKTDLQKKIGRIAIIADAAHSFGAERNGVKSGASADFTSFSFHAVKNLTTAEGGAVTWKSFGNELDEKIYKEYMLLSLHGQSKDALAKTKLGAWEYDIISPAYKCNMTDIMAAIGLGQFERYADVLKKRREIIEIYNSYFENDDRFEFLNHYDETSSSSGHLYLLRLIGENSEFRNKLIEKLAEKGIATNVHYKPLPLLTAYKNLGFDIKDYPNAFAQFENEITLPLNTVMTLEDAHYVAKTLLEEYVS